jgi:radical SAM superfamily enzyme YgiQ (UPF0313 family)
VLAEIDTICSIWPHPFIEFADDNSFVNKDYWRDLLPKIGERKIRWFTETDLSVADDPELLKAMRAAGCAQVLIGLESPSQGALAGLETRRNWKQAQAGRYREAIQTIQEQGISVNGCFIFGLDEHGVGIFDEVYDFVEETGLHEVQITLQTPFPGTPLYDRLQREGRLLDAQAWDKCTLFDINFQPKSMSREELSSGFKELSARLYGKSCTTRRKQHFKKILRSLAKEQAAKAKVPAAA